MNSDENPESADVRKQPSKGEFPFPIMDGERESQILTWVRNHSSYLTVGGFLGALQAGAAYTRGVIGNLIILMPALLPVGILLGLLHQTLIDSPLAMSRYSMLIGLILTLLYFGYDIGKNYVIGRTVPKTPAGYFSTKWQFFCSNFIAISVLLVAIIFLIDFSPHVIEFVRKNFAFRAFGLKECAAMVLTSTGIAGGVIRYFPKAKKIQVQILVVLVGILSFAIIWGLTLRIANYVYYGLPPNGWLFWIPAYCLGILTISGLVAVWNASGIVWPKRIGLWALILLTAVCLAFPCLLATIELKRSTEYSGEGIGTLTRPLARVANGLTDIKDESKDEGAHESATDILIRELIGRKIALDAEAPTDFESQKMIAMSDKLSNWLKVLKELATSLWKEANQESKFRPKYYARTALFLEQFETISDANPKEKQDLLQRLSRSAVASFADKVGLDDAGSSTVEFPRVVLQRVLSTSNKLNVFDSCIRDVTRMTSDELKTWLDEMPDLTPIRMKLASMRVPVSIATDYLKLSGDREGEAAEFVGKSSPDFALNGPALFTENLLSDESLKNEIGLAKLRRALLFSGSKAMQAELAKLDDEWFESRGSSRSAFDWCANVSRNSLLDLTDTALLEETDVNANGIRRYVRSNFVGEIPERLDVVPTLRKASRRQLIEVAFDPKDDNRLLAAYVLGELYDPSIPFESELGGANPEENAMLAKMIYRREVGKGFSDAELLEIMAAQFIYEDSQKQNEAEHLIRRMSHGKFGNLNEIENVGHKLFEFSVIGRLMLLGFVGFSLGLFCLLFVDPNSTSVHGFYRDRLSSAFIVTTEDGMVAPERQVLLSQLSNYRDGRSTAPYHLINAALNLQGSNLQDLRDRKADFFVFSKLFVGGVRTGFVRTKVLEAVSPKLDASSAMAISAGAASPNMGKYTVSLATFLLTMLNVRLGYWIPNPDQLQASTNSVGESGESNFTRDTDTVFSCELGEIRQRRLNGNDLVRAELIPEPAEEQTARQIKPSVNFDLFGIAFSGGGIRSAAVNMGILQMLKQFGLFDSVDYLSTVSGGGYLGTSVTTFMRNGLDKAKDCEEIEEKDMARSMDVWQRFRWQPRFLLLYKEMFSMLDATSPHINVSDGGHVENLGAYELLRRRCKVIIIGEGESDPEGKFPGLSTLMRLAEIDMNVKIEFRQGILTSMFGKPKPARIVRSNADGNQSAETDEDPKSHFAVGKITYPRRDGEQKEYGYLLYLRSSLVGNEDQIIKSYERSNTAFPHESTADQMFNEGQFEAYRRLGIKMMTDAIQNLGDNDQTLTLSFSEMSARLDARYGS